MKINKLNIIVRNMFISLFIGLSVITTIYPKYAGWDSLEGIKIMNGLSAETVLSLDLKCLQPQPNAKISKNKQSYIHFISQHQFEIKEMKLKQDNYEYSVVHEVLTSSRKVLYSEMLNVNLKTKGDMVSISLFEFPWLIPTNLPSGKYKYRVKANIKELSSQHEKEFEIITDFFIK